MPLDGAVFGLWFGAVIVVGIGTLFAKRQNSAGRAPMGGAISRAKQVWLVWAVYVWFVATPVLAFAPIFPSPARIVLGAFSGFMLLRGLIELVMLFVTKNWRPPYGIAHDVACVVLLLGGLVWIAGHDEPVGGWALAYLGVLTVSLMLETYYAFAFHGLVQGRTTGDDGVWFADAADPRFARINRITALANAPLLLFMAAFLIALTGGR